MERPSLSNVIPIRETGAELTIPAVQEPDYDLPFSEGQSENPFDQFAVSNASRVKQVWAIGGGKGGVGKSLIAANLAISLSRLNHRVTAIDLDLGAANLHTALGIAPPQKTLGDFLSGARSELGECVTETPLPNLSLISGSQDGLAIADLTGRDKTKLLQSIRELDSEYVLIDLGAGTGKNTIDFFLYADIGLVTLLPEPTSIENVYRFLKGVFYRKLLLSPSLSNVREIVQSALDPKNANGIKTPTDLQNAIAEMDPEASLKLKMEIDRLHPKLVVNQVRTQTDIDIGFSVKSVCKKYFGMELDYVGYLDYDSSVWQSVRRKRPLLTEFPNSKLAANLDRITKYLLKRHANQRSSLL